MLDGLALRYNNSMIPFKRSNESVQEGGNFFLELKLLKLQVKDAELGPVKISVFKGLQKLDETASFDLHRNQELVIDESVLNFHVRNFEKKRNVTFKLQLDPLDKSCEELGSFNIHINSLILAFTKDGVNSFARTDSLGDHVLLEYMLFVDKTKTEVERSLKSYEVSRKNSLTRDLAANNQWIITSPGGSENSTRRRQQSGHVQEQFRIEPMTPLKSPKQKAYMTASQEDNLSNLEIKEELHNKVWFQMEDGKEKVNNLVPRNQTPSVRGSMGTNIKLVAGLGLLGMVVYLIILLDDLDYGMGLVKTIIEDEIRSNYL